MHVLLSLKIILEVSVYQSIEGILFIAASYAIV